MSEFRLTDGEKTVWATAYVSSFNRLNNIREIMQSQGQGTLDEQHVSNCAAREATNLIKLLRETENYYYEAVTKDRDDDEIKILRSIAQVIY